MKKLSSFLNFDTEAFLKDKKLVFKGVKEWREYTGDETQGKLLGTKVDLLIMEDGTHYENSEEQELNVGETLTVKTTIPEEQFKDMKKMRTELVITNVKKANVYGNFNNNLSIEASLSRVQAKAQPQS
ncbi:hypothetical protein [Staphylococcus capitis]|uniref:hypothetical protein n=1 Tax=Staphylococcus capitis TaxID=29388 RepID=UPI003CEA4651